MEIQRPQVASLMPMAGRVNIHAAWSSGLRCIFFCMFTFFVSSEICGAGPKPAYKKYENVRFGYAISYPEALLFPQGESDNGDGQRFLSKEGDVEMLVWGSNNALAESLKSNFQKDTKEKTKEHPDKRVTYKHLKGNAYVVSGYIGEKICAVQDNPELKFWS